MIELPLDLYKPLLLGLGFQGVFHLITQAPPLEAAVHKDVPFPTLDEAVQEGLVSNDPVQKVTGFSRSDPFCPWNCYSSILHSFPVSMVKSSYVATCKKPNWETCDMRSKRVDIPHLATLLFLSLRPR